VAIGNQVTYKVHHIAFKYAFHAILFEYQPLTRFLLKDKLGILKELSVKELAEAMEELIGSQAAPLNSRRGQVATQLPDLITFETFASLEKDKQTEYINVSTGEYFFKKDTNKDISQVLLDFRLATLGKVPSYELDSNLEYEKLVVDKFSNSYKCETLYEQEAMEWLFAFLYTFMSHQPNPRMQKSPFSSNSSKTRAPNNGFCMFLVDIIATAFAQEKLGEVTTHGLYLIQFVRQSGYLSTVLVNRLNLMSRSMRGFMLANSLLNSITSHNLSVP
jgi:hypothetical protein